MPKLTKSGRNLALKNQDDMAKTKDSLKKQLQAKAQRLRRHTKRANVFRQDNTYRNNAKKLYRELGKKAINIQNPPSLEEVEAFWAKYGTTARPITMVSAGSKTKPRKTCTHQPLHDLDRPQEGPHICIVENSNSNSTRSAPLWAYSCGKRWSLGGQSST